MENQYLKGELLQVETKNDGVIEGRFYSMNSDKSRISLFGVKEHPEGVQSEGISHYYNTEVRKIVKLQDPDELANEFKNHLKISQKECEDIIKISKKPIFINQVDKSFHDALEDLKQYSYIAVSIDGASMGRKCKMPFLVMSSLHQIYIFDIQVMQFHSFDAGLRDILESQTPKKIIHDCRKLADCLYHKHNVHLKSVFDTQVGDIIISKNKSGYMPRFIKSLQECLNIYLGLPLSTIEDKLDIVQCTERPLTAKIKETLAMNIAYLHRLSEIINEQMLLPFERGVEYYVENLRSKHDFEAWELSGKLNQIPKEFKSAIEY